MTDLTTKIETTFVPTTELIDGWYHPAVRMESNIHATKTTVYDLEFQLEADAQEVANSLSQLQASHYAWSMREDLNKIAERFKKLPALLDHMHHNFDLKSRKPRDLFNRIGIQPEFDNHTLGWGFYGRIDDWFNTTNPRIVP